MNMISFLYEVQGPEGEGGQLPLLTACIVPFPTFMMHYYHVSTEYYPKRACKGVALDWIGYLSFHP